MNPKHLEFYISKKVLIVATAFSVAFTAIFLTAFVMSCSTNLLNPRQHIEDPHKVIQGSYIVFIQTLQNYHREFQSGASPAPY